jgi:transcription initiation factor TFIIIB Brf1 subunit/transcription initiation factor TFIIB
MNKDPHSCPKCHSTDIYDTILNEICCRKCGHVDLASAFLSEREWKIEKILSTKSIFEK